ncbi:MAG TPA: DUF2336 domain-containing protein [Sphingomicrobium sp.]|jgi:hypothetical protein
MMPEEWPIAAPAAGRSAPARAAGCERLDTVRADFFLPPAERLTEQERALMTAMLHCLIGDIAADLRAALPVGRAGANDDETSLVEALTRSGLLDEPELIALLLRRADEERIGSAARARSGRRGARALQALVSHQDAGVAAAAMGLILGQGRRRDRFGQCLLAFDDLPPDLASRLAAAVAAVMRHDVAVRGSAEDADAELGSAVAQLLHRHDADRSSDVLTARLLRALVAADALSDELLAAAAQEGEVAFLAGAIGLRAEIAPGIAIAELLSGEAGRLARLLRCASFSRDLAAAILASIGDLLGMDDPAAAIAEFDNLHADEVAAARNWLAASPHYRAAVDALSGRHG